MINTFLITFWCQISEGLKKSVLNAKENGISTEE